MQEFEKTMFNLTVFITKGGRVCITQDLLGYETQEIILNPAQIDVLIEWLKETKTNL